MSEQTVIASVRSWVENIVVGLNLCPFAKRELVHQRIGFTVSSATSAEQLAQDLSTELERLERDETIETSLLIHPGVLRDFEAYNQFLDAADGVLIDRGLEGIFQIASFHPEYRFAGTAPDDAENYSNRSPYPMLHILREGSVEAAIDAHPNSDEIPQRNIELLNRLGPDKLQSMLKACMAPAVGDDEPSGDS